MKESQIFRFQRLWIGNLPAGAQQLGELQVQLAQIDQQARRLSRARYRWQNDKID